MTTHLHSGPNMREWTAPNGEEMFGLAPALLAVAQELRREGAEEPTIMAVDLRWRDYAEGRRDPSPELIAAIRGFDREQRDSGYAGPPLPEQPA